MAQLGEGEGYGGNHRTEGRCRNLELVLFTKNEQGRAWWRCSGASLLDNLLSGVEGAAVPTLSKRKLASIIVRRPVRLLAPPPLGQISTEKAPR
jgi:hypothetical protein